MKLLVICQNLAFDIDLQKIKLKHTKDKIKNLQKKLSKILLTHTYDKDYVKNKR